MKLTAFLLLIGCLHVAAKGKPQTVTLSVRKAPLQTVFRELVQQTGVSIVYDEGLFAGAKPVSMQVKDAPISEVISKCLVGSEFSPRYEGNMIVFSKTPSSSSTTSVSAKEIPPPITIKGRIVNEEGAPMEGVTIKVKGSTTGTSTNSQGDFSLVVNEKDVLDISFIGYESQSISVRNKAVINVTLEKSDTKMDQVVVVGYGTQKKKDLTGSVVRIDMANKAVGNSVNLFQAIQGAAPGLNIEGGGLAGEEPSISIRGQTSLSANDQPLIVLDGIIYNGAISDINVNDVESIDVLKDASAAAVYGSRSANGVILITTKRGKTDKPRFTLNGTYGVQDFTKELPVMNAEQYAVRLVDYYWEQLLYSWYKTNPTDPTGRPVRPDVTDPNVVAVTLRSQEEKDNYLAGGHDIDWIDEVSRLGKFQNYDVNVSGKSGRSNYYISGSYTDQDGVLLNDQFKRATVRANLESKVTDWFTVGLTSSYSNRDYSGLETGLQRARFASPLVNIYTPSGTYPMYFGTETYQIHPFANLLADNYDVQNNLFILGNAKIEVPFIKGLSYNFNYSNTIYSQKTNTFYPPTIYDGSSNNGLATKSDAEQRSWIINNIVSYSRSFAVDHRVNITMLYSRENRTAQNSYMKATGFGNSALGYNAMQLGTIPLDSSGAWEENSISYMARANYVFKDRYMVTGTIRNDGFSGFGASRKFATFPSLSVAWVASEEDFVRNVGDWLNTLKFRLSYGQNGNQGIGRYSSFSRMASNTYIYGGSPVIGVYPNTIGNPDLGWESTKSLNFGIDYAVLNERISGSIELYTAQTSNVLVRRTLPAATGYTNVWTNIGGIANKGIEIALTTVNIESPLRWESRFAFALNRDKITKLYGGTEDKDIGNSWFVGKPISAIYNYNMTGGLWTEQDLYNKQINTAGFYPGHWKLEDLNKDGKIDPNNDRSIIGYGTPNYRFSIGNTLSYKNFSLNIFINSVMGGNGYYLRNNAGLLSASTTTDEVQRRNQYAIRQYWTPDNGVNNVPGIFYAPPTAAGLYEDRSFIRLQDVSLTYRIGQKLLDVVKMAGCDIFLSGRNLYTWTKWSGWDPERADDNIPMMKSLTAGLRLSW